MNQDLYLLIIFVLLALLVLLLFLYFQYKSTSISRKDYDELKEKWISGSAGVQNLNNRITQLTVDNHNLSLQLDQKLGELNQSQQEKTAAQLTQQHVQQQLSKLQQEFEQEKNLNVSQQDKINQFQKNISDLLANNRFLEERLGQQKSELEEIRKTSQLEFQNLANKILEEKSQKFTQANKENLESILKPLGENLDVFKKKVEETYDKESKQRFSLEEKVKDLIELNHKLSKEANNLASALKGQSKKQGNWGEIILESILEKSGLQKNREYFIQSTLTDEDGKMFRPDVVIHLPDQKTMIIDSKVSLTAYDRFCAEEDKEQQELYLVQHIQSIRNHIDELAKKKYDTLTQGLDFTMMFIPIEPAYLVAIQEDQDLWAYAYNKRILMISPTNLIAALKLVTDLWKREAQNKNAMEIAKQGEKLYEKFVGFLESMEDIEKHLNRSQEAFLRAKGQLKDGRGNLITQAEKLKKLGLNTTKDLPANLVPLEDEEDEKN